MRMMCRGRASASASGAGFSIGAADDRFDNLVKLRRMRGGQEDAGRCRAIDAGVCQPQVADRAVRIEQVAALVVDPPDRRPHLVVDVTAAGDVARASRRGRRRTVQTMRSKLLGWPTSIAFAIVCSDGRGSKRPVVR